jgi:hypothetical protein
VRSVIQPERLPPVAWVVLGAGLMLAGCWAWQAIHPWLGLGPLAGAQLAVMIGALDRRLARANRTTVCAMQALAWFGVSLGACGWGLFVVAWLWGMT